MKAASGKIVSGQGPRLGADLEDLLLECTEWQLASLLQEAKAGNEKAELTMSARNKRKLITENIGRAVSDGLITLAQIHSLLADSEENVAQYHFFYQICDAAKLRLSEFDDVGQVMFPSGLKAMGFPNFTAKPVGEVWGDFRKDVAGWTLKRYWGTTRWELDRQASRETKRKITKVWRPRYRREVWLVRWRPANAILEICLPLLGSREEQMRALSNMEQVLSPVLETSDYVKFNLDLACASIAKNKTGLNGQLRLGPARVPNSDGGSIVLAPRSSEQDLRNDPDRCAAIDRADGCDELVIYFKSGSSPASDIESEIKVLTGKYGRNSVQFIAKLKGKAVRHVTDTILGLEISGRKSANGLGKNSAMDNSAP